MTQLAPVIMLFARSPRLGEVKQRLARDVGERAALQAHQQLVEHALTQLDPLQHANCVRELWVTGDMDAPVIRAWARRWQARIREQVGRDLGHCMRHALHTHIRLGRRAVLVGSDVPPVDGALVLEAFEALQTEDVVLAPCEDGGYGLIGAAQPVSVLFEDVAWGTPDVCAQTIARAHSAGLSVATLRTLWDVDTRADWERFVSER